MNKGPFVTVGGLIVNKEGKILLVKSPKWLKEKYSVQGGHVEPYEKLQDAIKREIKEEVGLDVKIGDLLLIQEVIKPEEFYDNSRHFIFFDFVCYSEDTNVKIDNLEIVNYVWVSLDEALKLDVEKFTRNLLNKYQRYLKGDKAIELVQY